MQQAQRPCKCGAQIGQDHYDTCIGMNLHRIADALEKLVALVGKYVADPEPPQTGTPG